MGRLAGQTAWISGAASGIGEAVARLFASEGANVALADVQTERGQQVVHEIEQAGAERYYRPAMLVAKQMCNGLSLPPLSISAVYKSWSTVREWFTSPRSISMTASSGIN